MTTLLDAAAYKCSPKQMLSIGQSTGRVNLWEGAIRSGKTFASILRWFIFIALAPKQGELVMVGKSRDSLYRNVIAPIQSSPEYAFLRPFIRYRAGAPIGWIFGRRVHVLGANDSKAEGKIRGMTVVGAYVDELTMIPVEFFKQLLGRMSVEGASLFATTNPDSPAHWLKTEYLDQLGKFPDWRRWHFTLDDNPGLGAAYIASIKREFSGLWYKRFILGMWVAAEGAIYNMWDPDRHVRPWAEVPQMRALVGVGMDYGTTNPTTALLLGLSRELVPDQRGREHWRSRLWLVDEWGYDSRINGLTKTDRELAASFKEWYNGDHFPAGHPGNSLNPRFLVVDPAAASFKAQLHKDGFHPANGLNAVGPGIAIVANLLGDDHLMVTDRCEKFITEAPGYAWDPKKSEEGEDVPIKTADHWLDGGRYIVATTEQFWRPQLDFPHRVPLTAAA